MQDSRPRRMTVWLHQERSSVSPYGAADQRTMFTPDRIAIEKLDGTLVTGPRAPRDSFSGHQIEHTVGSAPSRLFQRLCAPDVSHYALPTRNERCTTREDRAVEGRVRHVARLASILSGVDRDSQYRSGLLFRRRSDASPSRLQSQHRWWLWDRGEDGDIRLEFS